ncbi:MAG: D-aminoacylase [Alphaproteobacteria bacterium]|nr:D-aminoacylase [Alphaproteobacteria bacterium]
MTEAPARCDLVLRGGTVVDGTGAPGFVADIAVTYDRIVAIGDLGRTAATQDLDATGRVVAPGFIDVHTHDDGALLAHPDMTPKVSQGVTTVVVGNCGFSMAPLVPRGALPQEFRLLGDESAFKFPTVAAYVDALEAAPPATNAALLVGHSTLRLDAVDNWRRPATAPEIAAMRARLREGLDAGAVGFSTGLEYAPNAAAPTEEVVALAGELAPRGGLYVTHTRDYMGDIDAAIEEALDIGRKARVPVVLSHHQGFGTRHYGHAPRTLGLIDRARRHQAVGLDAYPYIAGSTAILPDFVAAVERTVITWSAPHPECAGRDLAAVARDWGVDEQDAARRLAPGGAVYYSLSEADVRAILAYPHTMIGSDGIFSDGLVHPRLWGTFPRVLGHYCRVAGLFPLEEAVRRMTSLPAATFGLADRGELRVGHAADLVVFDSGTVADTATFEQPAQASAGIDWVFVGGVATWRKGRVTGARAGKVLRRRAGA